MTINILTLKNGLIALFLFTIALSNAQPGWGWAKQALGDLSESGSTVSVDTNGNVYIAGSFSSQTINLGNGVTATKPNNSATDVFVAKYNSQGQAQWVKTGIGDNNNEDYDNAISSAVDNFGNLYVSGYMNSNSIDFGGVVLNSEYFGDKAFIVKYAPDGTILYAKLMENNGSSYLRQLITDNDGNLYAVGVSSSINSFSVSDTVTLEKYGGKDGIVIKFDSTGNVLWAKCIGGTQDDETWSACIDDSGAVYIAGNFLSNSIAFGTNTLTKLSSQEAYVAKYDANGNNLWAMMQGGNIGESGKAVTADHSGHIYFAGNTSSYVITIGNGNFVNHGDTDIFVMQMNGDDGSINWGNLYGSFSDDYVEDLEWHDEQGLLMCGNYYSSNIIFGSTTITNTDDAYSDMYVCAIQPDGSMVWAKGFGSVETDFVRDLCLNTAGNCYLTGVYPTVINFGTTQLTAEGPTNSSFFLAKLLPGEVLGIDNPVSSTIGLWPNPVNQLLHIDAKEIINEVIVFDLSGKLVLKNKPDTLNSQIDLGELPAGSYVVKIATPHNVVSRLILKY